MFLKSNGVNTEGRPAWAPYRRTVSSWHTAGHLAGATVIDTTRASVTAGECTRPDVQSYRCQHTADRTGVIHYTANRQSTLNVGLRRHFVTWLPSSSKQLTSLLPTTDDIQTKLERSGAEMFQVLRCEYKSRLHVQERMSSYPSVHGVGH